MKITHVAQYLGVGGLEKIIFHLALEQQRQGHDVSVYIYDELRTWVDYFQKNNIKVSTPPIKKAGYDFSLMKRMNQDLVNSDVVHSHDLNPLMYLGPLFFLRKLLLLRTPKLVHTTHGLDHVKSYPRAMTYQKIFSHLSDQMVGVSEKIGQFYLNEIKLKKSKVNVIQNGIDIYNHPIDESLRLSKKQWIAARHTLDIKKPFILSLSRVVPLKNQKFLIEAIKQRPEYQLIVVGPSGDDEYYGELLKMQNEHIVLVGPQEAVNDYNLGCDIYASASSHEGIPVAVLEAMAVKTPCLVTDIPGHRTLLKYGKSVELFTENNSTLFLNKLDDIIVHKENYKEQIKNAHLLVEEQYSVSKMVEEYFKVYKK